MMMSMSPMVRQGYGHGPGSTGGVSPGPGGPPMTPMTPISFQQLQQQQQQQQQIAIQPPGGSVSLALLIDFILQKTHNELTVMAELLPRKTDMERKQDIFGFSSRTRLLFTRLLALVKWGSSAAKVDKSVHIMAFLEKQSLLFTDTADVLARIARETLVHARLPNFHVPAAVEVLTTGTYSRLPTCIRERIVPPDPVTGLEKKQTLQKLNQVIQHRLVTSQLPSQMRNHQIDQGRVSFQVENEFEVSLTVLGDGSSVPWRIIEIDILVEDKDIGDGMALVHPLQLNFLHQLAQGRVETSSTPLKDLYDTLHSFAQSLQLEVLYTQALKLCRERLGEYLSIEEYAIGQSLVLGYWNELSSLDPRAELGYRILVSVDLGDPAKPLGVTHQPPLPLEEAEQTVEGLRMNQLEKMLVQTVYLRSRSRLAELSKDLRLHLSLNPTLSGSPPVLNIPILVPSLPSEELVVTVNVHSGRFLVHIPQITASPPVVNDIQQVLNAPTPDMEKLKSLLSDLRYWLTERRCEKTLQHLPATPTDGLSLLRWEEDRILSRIGPHRITIKFQKHPYAILIVEFCENGSGEIDFGFHLVIVKKTSADENEEVSLGSSSGPASSSAPKFYLRPISILPLDIFASTHGPSTTIHDETFETAEGKRKNSAGGAWNEMSTAKKQRHPPYFIPELAHIVAMCDERLPFSLLAHELTSRGIIHGGCIIEGNGMSLSIPILRFLMNMPGVPEKVMLKLHLRLQSAIIRSQVQVKSFKTWNLELKFHDKNLNVPGMSNPIHYNFEMGLSSDDHISKLVDNILDHWHGIARLFLLLERSKWLRRLRESSIVSMKSFTWSNFTLFYGPARVARANFMYSLNDKCYKVYFGGLVSHNPHTLLRPQLQAFLNSEKSWTLEKLVRLLQETYEPLSSLVKLPTTIQLGTVHNRPQLPVQTFVLIPQSTAHVRLVYNNVYCLDVHFQPEGLVSIRDGAYSLFDKTQVLGDLTPTQGLKAFLSKYVDESGVFRRRSQSEDDNPPSPISTMLDLEQNLGTPTGGPPSSSSFLSKPQSPAPGRSNPHTPASPHLTQAPGGFSPATSFANLASPPSLPHLSQPSPNPQQMMHQHQVPSPGGAGMHMPAPSPSGGPLSVPTPSPNPSSHNVSAPGPGSAPTLIGHPSPFFVHAEGSPAAVHSPWGVPGSPSIPRPSPGRAGVSPGGGNLDGRTNAPNRVLPQRSWAGAIPTILSHDALDILCTPITMDGQEPGNGSQSYPCSPLERFLGCSNLRRQLQRIVQQEEHLNLLPSTELGVLLFRSETMQFRVGLDPTNFQSLHLKITTLPETFQWSTEEVQLLETFFASKVVRPPFRPNGLAAFARLISLPPRVIRDLIQIIRLQLIPSIVEQQGWNWMPQLCLTVPPAALPIIAPGMPAVVISQSKFLIYLLLTKVVTDVVPMETESAETVNTADKEAFVVAPLVHDMGSNCTQLAEKRNGPVPQDYAALSHHVKRFTDFTFPTMGMDCSLFPTVQDVIANFSLPNAMEPQINPQINQQNMPIGNMPGQMVRPQMQGMMSPGQFAGGHPPQPNIL